MTKPSQSMGVISAPHAHAYVPRVAFVYSALALAETFVLFAVLILLFALVVRGMIGAFRKD